MAREDYEYELTGAEVRQGITLCLANAERLRARAVDMKNLGDSALAVYLASIRIEEISKILLFFEASISGPSGGTWPAFWRRFRSHPQKWAEFNLAFMKWDVVHSRAEAEALFRTRSWKEANFKNLGIYVDHRADRGWMNPAYLPLATQVDYVLALGDQALSIAESRMAADR